MRVRACVRACARVCCERYVGEGGSRILFFLSSYHVLRVCLLFDSRLSTAAAIEVELSEAPSSLELTAP